MRVLALKTRMENVGLWVHSLWGLQGLGLIERDQRDSNRDLNT